MTPLNDNQKLFLWCGIAACVAMGLYPPWKFVSEAPAPFGFLYAPPSVNQMPVKLDIIRLVVEWCLVAFVTSGLIATAQKSSAKENGASKSDDVRASQALSANNGAHQPAVAIEAPKSSSKKSNTKSIKFPDVSVGEVLVESTDDPDYWDGIGEARGVVQVPAKSNVQLEARKEAPLNLSGLKDMDPHALQSIDFSESEVSDEDLAYLAHFNRLYELDLSHTSITDEGVEHLSKINSLRKVWLDNTKITENSLDNLKKLQSLTKVSLTGTDITESSVKAVKEYFPASCEIIMASGNPA